MESRLTRWLVRKIKDRLQTLVWGAVAADVEAETLLDHVEGLDRIETAARKYEADGKPELAELLRRRAGKLDLDAPGSSALAALNHLSAEDGGQSSTRRLTDDSADPPKRRRGRPRKDESPNTTPRS